MAVSPLGHVIYPNVAQSLSIVTGLPDYVAAVDLGGERFSMPTLVTDVAQAQWTYIRFENLKNSATQ
jgi:hypothetical protein